MAPVVGSDSGISDAINALIPVNLTVFFNNSVIADDESLSWTHVL